MAGRNLELRPREEGTRDKAKIPVVRFPLDKITEHFQENISAVRGQFAVAEELVQGGRTEEGRKYLAFPDRFPGKRPGLLYARADEIWSV